MRPAQRVVIFAALACALKTDVARAVRFGLDAPSATGLSLNDRPKVTEPKKFQKLCEMRDGDCPVCPLQRPGCPTAVASLSAERALVISATAMDAVIRNHSANGGKDIIRFDDPVTGGWLAALSHRRASRREVLCVAVPEV